MKTESSVKMKKESSVKMKKVMTIILLFLAIIAISVALVATVAMSLTSIIVKSVLITLMVYWSIGTVVLFITIDDDNTAAFFQIGLVGIILWLGVKCYDVTRKHFSKRDQIKKFNQRMPIQFTVYKSDVGPTFYEFESIKELLDRWNGANPEDTQEIPSDEDTLSEIFHIEKKTIFSYTYKLRTFYDLIKFLKKFPR